jgi:L-lactate dehydrogenase complex protein LldE
MPEVSGAMVLDKTRSLRESGAAEMITADGGCLLNINGSLEKQQQAFRGRHLASFLWERVSGEVTS